MYAGGTVLVAYFTSPVIAFACYSLCQLTEWYDLRVCRDVLHWRSTDGRHPVQPLRRMMVSSAATSASIVIYVIAVAIAEGPGVHLGPLFFLFAAALYATMNTCQIPQILRARLMIYSAALLFIPIYDLVKVRPPLHSDLWMQLGTVLFVLFLLRECARKFMSNYRNVQHRLDDLRVERDRVAEAYEMQSQFVSIVSHELRTPLTSIKASLDLITNETVCASIEEIRQVARIGQSNSNRLATLINDLLDFQKLNAGKMMFQFQLLDLGSLVRDAAEANRAIGAGREIGIEVTGPARPVQVKADPDRLMQVMANVLSNAVKFSHRGGVVEVTVSETDGQGHIAIRDHGVGIPENSKDLVFSPFTQVDASDKRAFGGTGLGMSITKRIVEAHGGVIDYTSRVGEGTTFSVVLDLCEPDAAAEADQAPIRDEAFALPRAEPVAS